MTASTILGNTGSIIWLLVEVEESNNDLVSAPHLECSPLTGLEAHPPTAGNKQDQGQKCSVWIKIQNKLCWRGLTKRGRLFSRWPVLLGCHLFDFDSIFMNIFENEHKLVLISGAGI